MGEALQTLSLESETLRRTGEGLHRRQFIQLTTLATASALTGCHHRHAGDLTMALGWVPDVEYADLWVALDRGYIANEGLHFKYLPGGPNAPQPVLEISAREADFGDSDWLPFCDAITQGNDFVILASLFPVTPIGLLSYTMVPVGFSPEPLLQHAGDAYFCFVTNQPQTLGRMGLRQGTDFYVTRLYDLGYRVSTSLLTVERRTLKHRRTDLVRFLTALLRGHAVNAADPAYGARLAVERYGADLGLDLQQQTTLNRLQIPLETEPGATIPFWFSEEAFAGPMYAAARVTGRPKLPPPETLRDLSLLEEAYQLTREPTP
jgi:hypothetical protein